MTKQVQVRIEGRQLQDKDQPIVTDTIGVYNATNGKHYIRYDEKLQESNAISKNMIKITADKVLLTKKLSQTQEMEFNLNKVTRAAVHTPYGNLMLEVKTDTIRLTEETDSIEVFMEYSLSSEGDFLSDNSITITITSVF